MHPLLGFFNLGPQQIVILMVLGVLLFGRRLPEVGKSLGKAIKEFQHGFHGLENDLLNTDRPTTPVAEAPRPPQRILPAAPKFDANRSAAPGSADV